MTHMFDCPITARFIRIEVKDYYSKASLRFDLIGCPTNAGIINVVINIIIQS